MFKDKGGKIAENKPIVKVKVTNVSVNMVDVHVTTWNKATKEWVFKNWEPREKKNYNGLGSKGEVEEVYGENHTTNANNQSNIWHPFYYNMKNGLPIG